MKTFLLFFLGVAITTLAQGEIPWEWPSDPKFEDYAKRLEGSPYSARYTPPKVDPEKGFTAEDLRGGTAEIINAEGKVIYHWSAHPLTSFVLRGDRLFYSDYSPARPDITLSCVDLSTQKVIWTLVLPADLLRVVLQYQNRTNVAFHGGRLFVFSQQSRKDGKFSWELSPETGKVLQQSP